MRILYLTKSDVQGLVTMSEVLKLVEEAFKAKGLGKVQMPPKTYVVFDKYGGDFRVMPSYLEGLDAAGVKVVNSHPKNPERHGLPAVMATILLLDPASGAPLAIMDGTWITSMRTGATGGVAAKYLAREDSRIVAMIGAGVQARTQLLALTEVLELERVNVHSRTVETASRFIEDMEGLGVELRLIEDAKEAVEDADVIVTTTPSTKPVIQAEWVSEGTHINAIGADAPGKEELDAILLKKAKIVVDDYEQACHSGEVNVPLAQGDISEEDIHAELGEVIVGKKVGRVSPSEITIFDSTGLSIHDVIVAHAVFKKATTEKVGRELELF